MGGDSPAPFEVLDLSPTNAMAFLGPNGSGKSFTLECLAACLAGVGTRRAIDSSPTLILRLEWHVRDRSDAVELRGREANLLAGIMGVHRHRDLSDQAIVHAQGMQALSSAWASGGGSTYNPEDLWADDIDLGALASDVANDWRFAVTPVSADKPLWRVRFAARRGASPAIDQAIRAVMDLDSVDPQAFREKRYEDPQDLVDASPPPSGRQAGGAEPGATRLLGGRICRRQPHGLGLPNDHQTVRGLGLADSRRHLDRSPEPQRPCRGHSAGLRVVRRASANARFRAPRRGRPLAPCARTVGHRGGVSRPQRVAHRHG